VVGFYHRKTGYPVISIDNKSVQFDRRNDDIAGPHQPDPLILTLDWDKILIDFPYLSWLSRNKWKNKA
jgi:hypothetical protein